MLFCIALSACQKEQIAPGTSTLELAGLSKLGAPHLKRSQGDDGTWCCTGPGTNCTIKLRLADEEKTALRIVFEALATKNNAIISSAFADQRAVLITLIDEVLVDGVIGRTLTAEDGVSSVPGNRFVLISDGTEPSMMAYSFEYP